MLLSFNIYSNLQRNLFIALVSRGVHCKGVSLEKNLKTLAANSKPLKQVNAQLGPYIKHFVSVKLNNTSNLKNNKYIHVHENITNW